MAHISEYRKLSSKIEKLQEKIKFKNELLELDTRLVKENTEKKIQKFNKKETEKLYDEKFAISNLDEEVNKRLPNLMRKFNKKDYWLRREAIQTYRLSNYSEEATINFNKRIEELNKIKLEKENQVKEKLYSRLRSYILVDEVERNKQKEKIENLVN